MQRKRLSPAVVLLLAGFVLGIFIDMGFRPLLAQTSTPSKHQVEQQLADLAAAINQLQQELEISRLEHREAQQALRDMDLQVQQTVLALRELETQLAAQQQELASLEQQHRRELDQMHDQQDQLAALVSATYRLARQSRVKLVLNQDDPTQLGRMLAYYQYINRHRTARISELRELLREIQQGLQQVLVQRDQVRMAQAELQQALQRQHAQREQRQQLVESWLARIGSGEQQLVEYQRNRSDLEQLLERLGDLLADIPADLGHDQDLSRQKGRLPMPVKGRVVHAFGQRRNVGQAWQGWLIDAKPGTEVRSIAAGRVAFADWLRGYGLMLIIEHGDGFMSLYGYNESLLFEVGDWVDTGTVVATAGRNAAGDQGLYFELRRQGKALDPAGWLKR